jgi:hypothetical protein
LDFWPHAARIMAEAATTANNEIRLTRFMQFSLPKSSTAATCPAGFALGLSETDWDGPCTQSCLLADRLW